MGEMLLQTKLYAPPLRESLVPRPHLIEKLNAGLNRRLTLISASPGFGKTTLVSDWLSQTKRSFGWVSLDEDDNDITRFFTYVITAIQQIKKIGHTTRRLLQSSQPVLPKSLATAFVNDCISTTSPFILVLDDYHNIIEPSINEVVAYILDNMPPNLHLVFTSRVDPLLPISRLRARGHMQELRTDDLRFTKDEAAEFLKIVMGLNLTVEQSSALDTRTEGWIAGLQMAGLSIQGLKSEDKIANFVADFTGSHRYIFDYLTDEVLQQQPESIKDFLVQTSILDQFNSDLCEAVTGQKNSKSILATLESANMFLFPLDENREWYRYHHLFADLLHQRLLSRFPEMIPDLYQRASQWYADHEDVEQAVLYALAGGHATEAAQLLDQSAFQIIGESRLRKLHGLLGKIPEDVRGQYPRLDIAQGWLHMFFGEYDTAEKCLYHAEEKLSSYAYSPIDFPRDFARAYIAMVRSYSATRQGFLSDAVDFSEEALTLLEEIPEESARVLRGTILINLGQTQVGLDDLENARATYDQAILDSQASERVSAVMAAYTCLMQLERNRGRLGIARSAGHQGLAWLNNFKGNDSQLYPSESELRIQLFLICYEQNRLVQAKEHLHISLDLYKATSNQGYVECLHYLFLVALAEGELENAVNIHQEAIPILKDFPFFIYQRYLADCLDRIIRLHRMQPAEKQWIQELHLWLPSFEAQISEVPNSRQEPQLLIKAKALADVGNLEESLSLLEYMTNAAESASRCGDLIQYRVQQSLVLERLSQRELAIDCLEKAASLAASENFMRTFLDEEKGLSQLIYLLPKSPYRDEIISNFLQTDRSTLTSSSIASGDYSMVEPLSERELEVLSLLATHLSGPEIADRLDISINTYKTHAKNIYGKLGVSSRNKAVVNARALGLL
jgi:LuxR family maltose regulon positive regulatory protein